MEIIQFQDGCSLISIGVSVFRFSGEKSVESRTLFDDICAKSDVGSTENDDEKMGCDQIEEREIPKFDSEVANISNASTSKYQFFAGNSVYACIEEPQTMNFTVHEMFVISHDESSLRQESLEKDDISPEIDFPGFSVDFDHKFGVNSGSLDDIEVNSCSLDHNDCVRELSDEEEEVEKQSKTESSVFDVSLKVEGEGLSCDQDEDGEIIDQIDEIAANFDEFRPSVSDSDDFWASIHTYDGFLVNNEKFDSEFDEILHHKSYSLALEPETPIGIGDLRVDYDQDSPSSIDDFLINENNFQLDDLSMDYDYVVNQKNSKLDVVNDEFEHEDVESSYIELEPESFYSTNNAKEHKTKDELSDPKYNEIDEESSNLSDSKDLDGSDEDDQMGGDVLLEQKELIRQMKKEMRQLKISGLPTILEESESPRVEEDLRPLRIDERIGHKDRMDEIQTFYRRYLDKMRKLDILSQQTMYAIGKLSTIILT